MVICSPALGQRHDLLVGEARVFLAWSCWRPPQSLAIEMGYALRRWWIPSPYCILMISISLCFIHNSGKFGEGKGSQEAESERFATTESRPIVQALPSRLRDPVAGIHCSHTHTLLPQGMPLDPGRLFNIDWSSCPLMFPRWCLRALLMLPADQSPHQFILRRLRRPHYYHVGRRMWWPLETEYPRLGKMDHIYHLPHFHLPGVAKW